MYRESYYFARILLDDTVKTQPLDPQLIQESDYERSSGAKNTQQHACKVKPGVWSLHVHPPLPLGEFCRPTSPQGPLQAIRFFKGLGDEEVQDRAKPREAYRQPEGQSQLLLFEPESRDPIL